MLVLVDMIACSVLPLGHVFGLAVGVGVCDAADRLLELLDVLKFVVGLATLPIFLFEFVFLEVVLLRHPFNIRIRILALAPTLLFLHLLLLILISLVPFPLLLGPFLGLLPSGGGRRLDCLLGGGRRGPFLG